MPRSRVAARETRRVGRPRRRDARTGSMRSDRWTSSPAWPEAAGATVVLRVLQERPKPDPSTFLGAGKVDILAASCAETERRRRDRRQRADAGAVAAARGGRRTEDRRSHPAHSRHLRPTRADPGRASCRSSWRSCSTCCRGSSAAARRCRGWAAASAREVPAKPSSRPTGGGSGRAFTPSTRTSSTSASAASQLRERRQKTSVPTVALVGYTNAGKTTLVQHPDAGRGRGLRRAVRDARSADPPGASAGPAGAAAVGHGRIHRPAATRAGGRFSGDARGGRRSRPGPARDRCSGARSRAPRRRRPPGPR